MFIYKFMAGFVDTKDEDEEDSNYDPHVHRKIEKPTSYMDTMAHMLKGSLGAGILAIPNASSRMGLVGCIVGIAAIGVFATYCMHLLIRAQYLLCKRWKRGYMAYPKSMKLAVQDGPRCLRWSAPVFYYTVDVVLITWQLGICVVFFLFISENIKQVCDHYGWVIGLRLHLCYMLVPQLLLNLVKDLKLMTPMSTISNAVTFLGLILVFFYLVEEGFVLDEEKLRFKGLEGVPVFVGVTLFAMEAVGVVLAIEYNMENPKQFVGLFGIFNIGMFAIIALYMLVGVFGYLKYGDEIKASITLNLPKEEVRAQAAQLSFALAITLSFPLQNFVAYNIIWRKIKKKINPTANARFIDYSLRIMLVVFPWLLAVAVPELGPVISLIGAFCLSLLTIVFPGIMDACYWYPTSFGRCYYRLVRDALIVLLGLLALLSGCYTSILEIIEALSVE